MKTTKRFNSLSEVRAANKAIDNHWFDRGAMRFFNTRIESNLLEGQYFITSEQPSEGSKRMFSVREAEVDGSIDTLGEFNSYPSKRSALAALKIVIEERKVSQ
jgi:hypothetical protein